MNPKQVVKSVCKFIFTMAYKDKNKIVFESEPDFCDNSRCLYDYMIKNKYNEKYKMIWCVKNPKNFKDMKVKNVSFTSFREKRYLLNYLYHIATAKTVIYTHATPPMINTSKQTVACLWHGTPLKHMNFIKTDTDPFTFIASASKFCSDALADCFQVSQEKIKVTGYPRCDTLFEDSNVLKKLDIDRGKWKKIVLWMPTFRQSSQLNIFDSHETQTGLPLIETSEQLTALNQKLQEQGLFMIIKLHPLQDLSGVDLVVLSNIKMLTSDELDKSIVQLYHLVSNVDILLTDYSSIYFDYLLLDRPIGFIIDDIEEYNKKRGFVTQEPLEIMPGTKMKTVEELYRFFEDVSNDKDEYANDRARVNDIVNEYKDNKSALRLLDLLEISK
ncbi:MAG: CDP-glycerol glycerophosphotransferase family protein [Oscillospiraceae bacterium]